MATSETRQFFLVGGDHKLRPVRAATVGDLFGRPEVPSECADIVDSGGARLARGKASASLLAPEGETFYVHEDDRSE